MVEVPYPIKDDAYPTDDGYNYTRLYIPSGLQRMDGLTALRYARSRNFDSDFGRQRRQQQVLQAIREQGLKLDLLLRLPEFIKTFAGAVKTDFDSKQIPGLVSLGMSIKREDIKSFGITPEMTHVVDTPQGYYLEPNWPKIYAALREMQAAPRAATDAGAATPTPEPVVPRAPTARVTKPSPTPPPAAARATATTAPTVTPARLRVWVRNGTHVQGLAARHAEVLRARGYTIVDVSQETNAGQYPRSVVYNYGAERAQAVAVAQALGLPASAVRLGPAPAPPGTDILVILGDDAT
jgi:hypothetical protein